MSRQTTPAPFRVFVYGTLKRGFSITLDSRGRVIRDASGVAEGESIVTKLPKGKIKSVVTGKEPQ